MDTATLKKWSGEVIRFLFPDVCMLCGRILSPGDNCGPETKKLQICTHCLTQFPVRLPEDRLFPCLSDPYDSDPIPEFAVWALFHYEMPVTKLLRNLKFQNWIYAGKLLGDLLAREFPKDIPGAWDAVIPIPLSEKRKRERGYNQAAVLGAALAEKLEIPLMEETLVRTRHTHRQSRYQDPAERSENVKSAFAVEDGWDIEGWNVLLVDDILTTGATLHEAARMLCAAGASCVLGVVAATHREKENGEGQSPLTETMKF